MRWITAIVLLLVGVGVLAGRLERLPADAPTTVTVDTWVRTVDGWERRENWLTTPSGRPALHPLVVAAGQAMFSLLALVAATSERPGPGRHRHASG